MTATTHLPVEGALPQLDGATAWLHSGPLTPAGLHGQVVAVQFCTFSCINWLRTVPYKIRSALDATGVGYPIAVDNDFAIWRAFDNAYWPAIYFVDAEGRIRHHHFGEEDYERSERVIQQLLADAGSDGVGEELVAPQADGVHLAADWDTLGSPETYVGYARATGFASPGGLRSDRSWVYVEPAQLALNRWALSGDWTVGQQTATLNEPGGRIVHRFHGRDLNLDLKEETMGTPTRRAVLKGAAALAGVAAAQTTGLPSAAAAAPSGTGSGHPKANVLLVHGAWVDGSSWNQVTAILQQRGHTVVAVQLPLTSLADDVAWTRHVLAERLQGPTVLAGHSYGGAVISGAATGFKNAIGLVFASAFAPDEGETLGGLGAKFPPPPGLAHTQPDSLGNLWFDPAAVPTNFAQDLPVAEARVLAAAQKPIAARAFTDPAGPPAWKTLPSWFLVSTQDRMINPDLERFMAARIHATTIEVRSSHASPASHPKEVAGLILAAARAGTRT